jgi:hypothetical protein
MRETSRTVQLLLVNLHADHGPRALDGFGHQSAELSEPRPHVQNLLMALERQLLKTLGVQDVIE